MPSVYNRQRLNRFPMIEDVRQRAIARLPGAIRGFLEGGSGDETCLTRNRVGFDEAQKSPHRRPPDCESGRTRHLNHIQGTLGLPLADVRSHAGAHPQSSEND
ncbi:MAG: hypothetical protein AAFY57_20455, partial [Cyanobacteria bacterium J06642_2]